MNLGGNLTRMKVDPLVSIITITYNSKRFLEGTIESVLAQEYKHLEYIIVDGGSTDGTLSIIEKYRNFISKVISEPDEGISDAMNKGIGVASGEIIGIIHSDDYYADPSVIKRVVDVFSSDNKIKVVYGIQDYIDPESGKKLLQWGRDAEPTEMRKRMYMPHPTVFCKREVYDEVGLFRTDYRCAMDYEWALRVTKYTRPFFLSYKIACMRDTGTSGRLYRQSFAETERALKEQGFYFDYLLTVVRDLIKLFLLNIGLKKFLYAFWQRNVQS